MSHFNGIEIILPEICLTVGNKHRSFIRIFNIYWFWQMVFRYRIVLSSRAIPALLWLGSYTLSLYKRIWFCGMNGRLLGIFWNRSFRSSPAFFHYCESNHVCTRHLCRTVWCSRLPTQPDRSRKVRKRATQNCNVCHLVLKFRLGRKWCALSPPCYFCK